ncbi:MAG TPA: hypothetical protein VGJ05_10745 [Fimbriiglobus sp.]|jgi:hypothetical protein
MRRIFLAAVGMAGLVTSAWGQPPTRPILIPDLSPIPAQNGLPAGRAQPPSAPRPLPPSIPPQAANPGTKPSTPGKQGEKTGLPPVSDVVLPYPEKAIKLDRGSLIVRKAAGGWQVWGGNALVKNFGDDRDSAEDAAKSIRDLNPTEWVTLGTSRPIVGYAIADEQARFGASPKQSANVDLLSVRAESLRGAWVVRDANSILLNFGPDRRDAEQAAAAARKYGFNRIGIVGRVGSDPAFQFFYATPETQQKFTPQSAAAQQLFLNQQIQTLHRTGVPVPGVGFIGERVVIDLKKVAVRRDGNGFVLASGSDVLANFGSNEWSARDAVRILQEMRVTEFCTVSGQTFFLENGKVPRRVPFAAQGFAFDSKSLVVKPSGRGFGVFERNGRQIFPVDSKADGENLIRTVQAFGFNQTCQIGMAGPNSLKFLAKSQ